MELPSRYRWAVLGAGSFASAAFAGVMMGLPALGPLLRADYGLSLAQTGLIFASVPLGVTTTILAWGALSDRVGERLVLTVGLIGTGLSLILAGLSSSAAGLWAGLLLAGMLGSSTMGASGRAIIGWFTRDERGFALAVRQTAIPLGGATASLVLPHLAGAHGLQAAFLALAGLLFTAAVCCATLVREPGQREARERGPMLRDRRLWRLSFASALLMLPQAALTAFLVLFLHDERGFSPGAAAAALAAVQVGGAAGRLWTGRLSDRLGRRIGPLRVVAVLEAAVLFACAATLGAGGAVLYPLLLVAGMGALCWNSLAIAAAAELSGYRQAGTGLGLIVTVVNAANVCAATGFGALVGVSSWAFGFAVLGVTCLAGRALLTPLSELDRRRAVA